MAAGGAFAAVVVCWTAGCMAGPPLEHLELIPVAVATPETLEFSPDGKKVAALGGGPAMVWTISEGRGEPLTLPAERCAGGGGLSRDGSFLVCGGQGAVTTWALPQNLPLSESPAPGLRKLALLPGGRLSAGLDPDGVAFRSLPDGADEGWSELPFGFKPLFLAGLDGAAAVLSEQGWVALARPDAKARLVAGVAGAKFLAASRDGRAFVVSGPGPRLRVWDAEGAPLADLKTAGAPEAVALSPDGARLAYVDSSEGRRYLRLRAVGGETLAMVETGPVRRMTFSPDGKRLSTLLTSKLALWRLPP